MTTESISTLVPSTNAGRYALDDPVSGPDVTSGQSLAVLLGGYWIEGRVEHAGNLYTSERSREPSAATTSSPPMAPYAACAWACRYTDAERKHTHESEQASYACSTTSTGGRQCRDHLSWRCSPSCATLAKAPRM
jgi:uncharacterized protein DUF5348